MADFKKEISSSVDSLLEREGSLMTGDNHLQAREILKGFKEKYIKAIDAQDKSGVQKIKNITKKMASSIAKWQGIGDQVPDINNKIGWSKGMDIGPATIISSVSSGNFELAVDEKTGDVTLDVPIGKEKRKVTSKEYDDAISSNVAPLEYIGGVLERGNNMFNAGNKGGNEFDYDAIYSENKMKIDGDGPSLQSFLHDEIIPGQPTISKFIEDHPEFEGVDPAAKKTIMDEINKGGHTEIVSDLIAKAFTEFDKKSFEKGKATFEKKNKTLSEEPKAPAETNPSERRQSLASRISSAFQKLTKQ